jgi:hypothetical protein
MIKRLGGVVALMIFALATSASAECAWVLWHKWLMEEPTLERAFPSAEGCYAAIAQELSKVRSQGEGESIYTDGPDRAGYYDGQRKTLATLRCLPETVDPRGPKGK